MMRTIVSSDHKVARSQCPPQGGFCYPHFSALHFRSVTIDDAFAQLTGTFATLAEFQGGHFKYAVKNGSVLIEVRRNGRYYYWLLVENRFLLVGASLESKLAPLRTIGQSLKPAFVPDQ